MRARSGYRFLSVTFSFDSCSVFPTLSGARDAQGMRGREGVTGNI